MLTERIKGEVSEEKPDNPTYINLKTQIFVTEAEIRNLSEDRKKTKPIIEEYRSRIEKTPLVEKEYIELTRDYSSAKRKYEDISGKLMAARVEKGMAESQFSERFVIVDPAALPENAYKPNRKAIIILGFIFAVVVGIGLAVVRESMDHSIKTIEELNSLTDNKVLSFISMVETDEERHRRHIKHLMWAVSLIVMIVIILAMVNYWFMPIDEIWSIILRRFK
jgi:capsular polysaccharide biosynthesis protein